MRINKPSLQTLRSNKDTATQHLNQQLNIDRLQLP